MYTTLWGAAAIAATALLAAAQPAAAQITTITDVRIIPGEAGPTVLLETANGQLPQTFQTRYGNTLVIDFTATQLSLDQELPWQQDNPAAGLRSVQVEQLNANSVRLTLIGDSEPPQVTLTSTAQGVAVQLPAATVATPPEAATAAPPATTPADSPAAADDAIRLVVSATRTEEDPLDVPRSVTVIERQEIEQQSSLTTDVGDILGKLVPGFGPPNERTTILRQSLRGRDFSVLIDGVPQSTNREFLGDLRTIDPSAIERIEIVRGPTAIYGADAPGGVINIITRQPEDGAFNARSGFQGTISPIHLDDSFGYVLSQFFSGRDGALDYTLSGSFEATGAAFDADGDRIAQGFLGNNLDESDTINLFGKLGWNLTPEQRLQFSVNYFDTEQDTEYISEATPLGEKARAVRVGSFDIEDGAGSRNTVLNLSYSHEDLLGSELQVQAYYRDYTSRSFPDDFRGGFFDVIGRSRLESQRWGGRLEIETPLLADERLNLFWGLDYTEENTEQPFDIFDPVIFDNSGGREFVRLREGVFVPPYELSNLGAFAQLDWAATEQLNIRSGLRYETIRLRVDDYETFFGSSAQGGDKRFDDTVFNLGATFDITPNLNLYANFAQGFSVPDFGRILRFPEFNGIVSVDESIDITEPQRVDSYEVGVRGRWETVQASLALFYTYSDLGVTLVSDEQLDILTIARAPKRTYGLEGTLDWQVANDWQVGGTLTLIEGEDDQDGDGNFEALGSRDIQPLKVTAYLEHQTTETWRNRLQLLAVGNRSVDNSSIEEEIDGYVTLDLISELDLGPGQLRLGVENLLNNLYFPLNSQVAGSDDADFTPAQGITFSLGYTFEW